MTHKLLGFAAILIALWALLVLPAAAVATGAALDATAAALACGVPALGSLAFCRSAAATTPMGQVTVLLAAMLVRMSVSLAAGMTLYWGLDRFATHGFLIWLAVFYVVDLFAEVGVLSRMIGSEASNHGG